MPAVQRPSKAARIAALDIDYVAGRSASGAGSAGAGSAAAGRSGGAGAAAAAPIPPHLLETPDFLPAQLHEGIDNDPQDFEEFFTFEERAKVLPTRRTLYLVNLGLEAGALAPHTGPPLPALQHLAAFLTAFTGLPHKLLPPLSIVPWASAGKGAKKRKAPGAGYMAVRLPTSLVRVRSCAPKDGEFHSALHCHDLLDALQELLPADAFAILGLTAHDIHEDGMPVGGRAFGGSRIAVISCARYAPVFDDVSKEWPGWGGRGGACLQAARAAHAAAAAASAPQALALTALWTQRTAVTAMHELGHCLGLDHCIYYSCFMGEIEGQAPYACPVCLRKLLCAVGGDALPCQDAAPAMRHYDRVAAFCSGAEQAPSPYWAAFGAWCSARSAELQGKGAQGGAGAMASEGGCGTS